MKLTCFLSGIGAASFLASGLFFLKFWRSSGDRFFLKFALACWLLAIEQAVALLIPDTLSPIRTTLDGIGTWIYLCRLLAFVLISVAVFQKNSRPS